MQMGIYNTVRTVIVQRLSLVCGPFAFWAHFRLNLYKEETAWRWKVPYLKTLLLADYLLFCALKNFQIMSQLVQLLESADTPMHSRKVSMLMLILSPNGFLHILSSCILDRRLPLEMYVTY